MKRLFWYGLAAVIVAGAFALAFHFAFRPRAKPGVPILVTRAIDGDTIVLATGERLRYIGMDTPEEVDPRKPVQCYAKEAAEENRALVEGKMIVFYQDVSKHDKYGRLTGFVYLLDGPGGTKGTFVNEKLVLEGYAFAYPYKPDTSKAAQFKADQEHAKSHALGLWSHCFTHREGARWQTNAL